MILGINLPEGAKVEITDHGTLLIIFDEKETRRDLWKARLDAWLTQGESKEEFFSNENLDSKSITITSRNKIKIGGV